MPIQFLLIPHVLWCCILRSKVQRGNGHTDRHSAFATCRSCPRLPHFLRPCTRYSRYCTIVSQPNFFPVCIPPKTSVHVACSQALIDDTDAVAGLWTIPQRLTAFLRGQILALHTSSLQTSRKASWRAVVPKGMHGVELHLVHQKRA